MFSRRDFLDAIGATVMQLGTGRALAATSGGSEQLQSNAGQDIGCSFGQFRPGTLVIVGARPGNGGGACLLQIADALSSSHQVLLVAERCHRTDYPGGTSEQGFDVFFRHSNRTVLDSGFGEAWHAHLSNRQSPKTLLNFVDCGRTASPFKAASLIASLRPKVIVDHVELEVRAAHGTPMHAYLAWLKTWASGTGGVAIVHSWLDRAIDDRMDFRPNWSDLPIVAQAVADSALLLFRPDAYFPEAVGRDLVNLSESHANGKSVRRSVFTYSNDDWPSFAATNEKYPA